MWEKITIFILITVTSITSFWVGRQNVTPEFNDRREEVLIQMERFLATLQENQRKILELQEEIDRLRIYY